MNSGLGKNLVSFLSAKADSLGNIVKQQIPNDIYENVAAILPYAQDVIESAPYIKNAYGILTFAKTVKDKLLQRKLIKFIGTISECSESDRKKLINKLEGESAFRGRVGLKIIETIEKLDDEDKAIIAAKIFILYLKNDINSELLRRTLNTLATLYIEDCKYITDDPNDLNCYILSNHVSNDIYASLVASRLIVPSTGVGGGRLFKTEVAEVLLKVLRSSTS